MSIDPDLSSVGAACVSPKDPRALLLSPVGTPCFIRYAAPTELEEEVFGASVRHTCRSYGTFKELFDLLIVAGFYICDWFIRK